jgi:DNA-binding phage protein
VTQPKPNQHYRLSLEKAKQDYKDGIITATGLVYYTVGIYRAPGQKLRVKDIDQFCNEIGINRSAFYKAISKLKTKGRLNWEAIAGVDLWIPTSNVVEMQSGQEVSPNGECLSPNGECLSPNGECLSPNGECLSPNGDNIQLESLFSNDSSNPSDSFQSFFNEQHQIKEAAVDLKNHVQDQDQELNQEVEKAVWQLQEVKCTPALEFNQCVLTALANHLDAVDDAIAYLEECIRTWSAHGGRQYNWTGVLVKALKEGQKPRFPSCSAVVPTSPVAPVAPFVQTELVHPLLIVGLESGEILELDPHYKGLWDADRNWHKQSDWLDLRLNEVVCDEQLDDF